MVVEMHREFEAEVKQQTGKGKEELDLTLSFRSCVF